MDGIRILIEAFILVFVFVGFITGLYYIAKISSDIETMRYEYLSAMRIQRKRIEALIKAIEDAKGEEDE